MIKSIILHITFFAANLALLSSVSQLFIRGRTRSNYNLSALFFCLAAILFQLGMIVSGAVYNHPWVIAFLITFIYIGGPLLAFAYYLVIIPEAQIPKRTIIFLLFAIVPFIVDIAYLLLPAAEKLAVIHDHISGRGPAIHYIVRLLFILAWMKMVLFLGLLFKESLSLLRTREHTSIIWITIVFIVGTIVSYSLIIAGYASGSVTLLTWGMAMVALKTISTFIVGQRYPAFLQILITEVERKRYQRSLLNAIDTDEVLGRLLALMNEEKIFFNEEMTLNLLASELGITPHQLSQLLNERLQMNFNSFINSYRVDEAKKMLIDEPDRSILSISYAVGFNSKSSFYEAFARFTGGTPQKFRTDQIRRRALKTP